MERRTARFASLAIVFALYGCGSSNKTTDAATDRPVTNDGPPTEGGPRVEAGVDVPMDGMGGMGGDGGGTLDGPRDAPPPVDVPPGVEAGPQGTGTRSIGPAGGTVTSVDNRATLEIPPGALTSLITFTIQPTATPAMGAVGTTYDINPFGTTFLIPAHVVFKPTAADITAGGGLASVRAALHDSGGAWTLLTTPIANAGAGTVRGDTTHLSVFGLVAGVCQGCEVECDIAMPTCMYEGTTTAGTGRCVAQGMGCSKCVPMCDLDGDGFCPPNAPGDFPTGDCDDNNPNVGPGAAEVCGNMVDENCNGHQDEGCRTCTDDAGCPGLETCRSGVCQVCDTTCDMTTCRIGADDTPGSGVPGRCAAYGRNNTCSVCVPTCDSDGDGFCTMEMGPALGGDCNDNNPAQSPAQAEICGNNVDDNCNGVADEGCTTCGVSTDCPTQQICLAGLCQACVTTCDAASCAAPSQCIASGNGCSVCVPACDIDHDGFCPGNGDNGGDCDDGNAAVNPNGREVCGNSKDDNCDGHIDEGCRTCMTATTCAGLEDCINGKCEVCQPCTMAECRFGAMDGVPGSGVPGHCASHGQGCSSCVPDCDMDGDGYCPQADPPNEQPGGDCNDVVAMGGASIHPGAREICGNMIDDDCNGAIDDGCTTCQMAAACGATQSCSSGK